MRRDTLASFFRRTVIAALPLVAAGCGSPSGPIGCGGGGTQTYTVDGGLGDGGCDQICGGGTQSCKEETNGAGQPIVECTVIRPCLGRRPEGLAMANAEGSALGRYFAEAAQLEAASVPAFRRLRAELRAHGSPRRLIDACTRAARDEVRHARSAARLARRFGATPPAVRLGPARRRSLIALAVENAREGCVGESFAALTAHWQAATAADPDVRAHLASIAADEARHAELAWEIDAWLRTRLDARERAHLEAVRADELAQIATAIEARVDPALAEAAGLPPREVARALHRAFAGEVARRA
jgi:hypothetical protein